MTFADTNEGKGDREEEKGKEKDRFEQYVIYTTGFVASDSKSIN